MTASGIEPATFWLVAQCHRVLLPWGILEIHNCFGLKVKQPFRVLDFGSFMDSLRSTMKAVRFAAFTDPDKDLLTCNQSTAKGTVNVLTLEYCDYSQAERMQEWMVVLEKCWALVSARWDQGCGIPWSITEDRRKFKARCLLVRGGKY
jgi:hypothetical protein